jgi:ABC-type cobalamin/Fe3+-siderophores transport system ATPase subunit
MKIIIVGPCGSGKTTLLHKIIRMNDRHTFSFIMDGIEQIGAGVPPYNIPNLPNMLITAIQLESVPQNVRDGALVLRCPDIRI